MDTNITKKIRISIREDEIFARCTNESLQQAYVRTKDNPKGDLVVIQDDDRVQFRMYFELAISNLQMLLAKRMDGSVKIQIDNAFTFELLLHDNHEENVIPMLILHCNEYVVKKILEMWYGVDMGSEFERLEINHCLQYRRNPVRRRIDPLF